jgi:hypothetical protein
MLVEDEERFPIEGAIWLEHFQVRRNRLTTRKMRQTNDNETMIRFYLIGSWSRNNLHLRAKAPTVGPYPKGRD